MPLADYFLPAKSVLVDGYPGTDDFFKRKDKQFEGLFRMVYERDSARLLASSTKRLFYLRSSPGGGIFEDFFFPVLIANQQPVTKILSSTQVFKAIADPGYVFVSWSGTVTTTTNPLTAPSGLIVKLAANFKKIGDPDPPLISIFPQSFSVKRRVGGTSVGLQDLTAYLDAFLTGIIPFFINTDVHPGGNIEGASAITFWTRATVLASVGLGASFTKIPARNPYGKPASIVTSTLVNTEAYKEHINELVAVAQKLEYIAVAGGLTAQEFRDSGNQADPTPPITCAGAKAEASTVYASQSYASPFPTLVAIEVFERTGFSGPSTNVFARLFNMRGKVQIDLSGITAGTAKAFFRVFPQAQGSSNSPPATADGNYHQFDTPPVGSPYLSSYFGDQSAGFSGGTCTIPISSGAETYGWKIKPDNANDPVAIVKPTFDIV